MPPTPLEYGIRERMEKNKRKQKSAVLKNGSEIIQVKIIWRE
jgi:hypothetical protein